MRAILLALLCLAGCERTALGQHLFSIDEMIEMAECPDADCFENYAKARGYAFSEKSGDDSGILYKYFARSRDGNPIGTMVAFGKMNQKRPNTIHLVTGQAEMEEHLDRQIELSGMRAVPDAQGGRRVYEKIAGNKVWRLIWSEPTRQRRGMMYSFGLFGYPVSANASKSGEAPTAEKAAPALNQAGKPSGKTVEVPQWDFWFTDLTGRKVSIRQYLGKVVYIDFWASWCGPCHAEFPWSKKLQSQLTPDQREQVVFLYISIDDTYEKWTRSVRELQGKGLLRGEHGFSAGGWRSEAANYFQLNSIPRYMLLNQKGEVVRSVANRPSQGSIVLHDIIETLARDQNEGALPGGFSNPSKLQWQPWTKATKWVRDYVRHADFQDFEMMDEHAESSDYAIADIDGDGKPGVIINCYDRDYCGTAGCMFNAFDGQGTKRTGFMTCHELRLGAGGVYCGDDLVRLSKDLTRETARKLPGKRFDWMEWKTAPRWAKETILKNDAAARARIGDGSNVALAIGEDYNGDGEKSLFLWFYGPGWKRPVGFTYFIYEERRSGMQTSAEDMQPGNGGVVLLRRNRHDFWSLRRKL